MTAHRRGYYDAFGKRALDVVVSATALIVLAPLLALLGLAVLCLLGSPVLYAEERAGRGGRPFRLRKFRTMSDARDADGRLLADEQRLSAFGRVLRHTSLDELPELLHVLTGEMSLVGPRPLPVRYLERYSPAQLRRLDVRPGLTGLAQTRGRNALAWDERFALDVWYVEHHGAAMDLRLLWATVKVVLSGSGVSHPGHATMHEFLGSSR